MSFEDTLFELEDALPDYAKKDFDDLIGVINNMDAELDTLRRENHAMKTVFSIIKQDEVLEPCED